MTSCLRSLLLCSALAVLSGCSIVDLYEPEIEMKNFLDSKYDPASYRFSESEVRDIIVTAMAPAYLPHPSSTRWYAIHVAPGRFAGAATAPFKGQEVWASFAIEYDRYRVAIRYGDSSPELMYSGTKTSYQYKRMIFDVETAIKRSSSDFWSCKSPAVHRIPSLQQDCSRWYERQEQAQERIRQIQSQQQAASASP